MGLDVIAFEWISKCSERPPVEDDSLMEWLLVGHLPSPKFWQSFRGLEEGVRYESLGESTSFRAGSYTGYNIFRAALCRAALGVEAIDVWKAPSAYRLSAFFELIEFADYAGTIGPLACADLGHDFAANADKVLAAFDESDHSEWLREKYELWRSAFELAAGRGLVLFV
jgi:hypothetical protein